MLSHTWSKKNLIFGLFYSSVTVHLERQLIGRVHTNPTSETSKEEENPCGTHRSDVYTEIKTLIKRVFVHYSRSYGWLRNENGALVFSSWLWRKSKRFRRNCYKTAKSWVLGELCFSVMSAANQSDLSHYLSLIGSAEINADEERQCQKRQKQASDRRQQMFPMAHRQLGVSRRLQIYEDGLLVRRCSHWCIRDSQSFQESLLPVSQCFPLISLGVFVWHLCDEQIEKCFVLFSHICRHRLIVF